MEDIRPYRNDEDDPNEIENVEWELAPVDTDDDVPFHIPRD
jgi:hypothetical protein